ncbi:MAG: TolC family protein [Candidatus Aminicenantes bacterium]|nr:TolC family protein [Candidatus Aminicenantes bacterium]
MKKVVSSFLILILMISLGGNLVSFSQEVTKKKISLSELIQEALEQNPQLKAARNEWQAALEVIPQAKSLPDPMLSYTYFGQSIETRLGPQRNKVSLSQKFPFFGKLSLKGEIAESASSIFKELYKTVKADIILKVKIAYFSLYWFDRSIKISQEEKEVLKRLAKIAEKKYETGKANQQDVLKAQLEISRITDRVLLLEQGRIGVVAKLNSLLNRPADSYLGEAEEFATPELKAGLEELYEWAKEARPELRKARYHIEKNEKSLKLAKKNYFPDFKLMFDYIDIGGGTTNHPEDGRNSWMGSIGINIPLWRNKLKAAEAETAVRLKASQEKYQNIENETLSRINELFFETRTAQEQVELYQYSLLPQAEQSLKASEVGYLAGKVDFLNLLDSERMVLQIKIGYFKAISDRGKSFAQLERVVGKDLINQDSTVTSRQ